MDKDWYYELIIDKYLGEPNLTDEQRLLLDEARLYFMEKSKQNKGIGMLFSGYIFASEGQNIWDEYAKVKLFVDDYVQKFAEKKGKSVDNYSLEFINYGRTQLVYVLTDNSTDEKVTILAKQPIVEYGKIKQEADNLANLAIFDKCVIVPIDYYSNNEEELYVTPYIPQARCVASAGDWGMYIPEPFYRFENFTAEQKEIVNSCMIAKLISLYDMKSGKGVAKCKLGGGDFMLPKGWEDLPPSIDATINNLYLIAAREMIDCSLGDYLDLIRSEFSRATINENEDDLVLNIRGRVPMSISEIENGIELGKSILEARTNLLEVDAQIFE